MAADGRIPYGDEEVVESMVGVVVYTPRDAESCPDCGVGRGEYHTPGCDVEQCPVCGWQLIGCGHEIDMQTETDNDTGGSSDGRTVFGLLDDERYLPQCRAMHGYLRGIRSQSDLAFEDWVGPMRHTDGEICLKIETGGSHPSEGLVQWFYLDDDGWLRAWWDFDVHGADVNTEYVHNDLRHYLGRDDVTIAPMLRADAPDFGDGDANRSGTGEDT